mmetsp:Transcript_32065/g.53875  ORF Transcript_32065/g.53875 Transcript_32065/m.53875 type:complete len:254 (-) Transcript_32065:1315-2076(-)
MNLLRSALLNAPKRSPIFSQFQPISILNALLHELAIHLPVGWRLAVVGFDDAQQRLAGTVFDHLASARALHARTLLNDFPSLLPAARLVGLEAGAPFGEELRGPPARHSDVGMLLELVFVPPLRLRERLRIVVHRVPGVAHVQVHLGEINVVRVQSHRQRAAFHRHHIYLPALFPGPVGEDVSEILREEQRRAELLGGGLETRRHVHIGGEVGCIHLVLGSYGALDGPPDVQAEAHLHGVVGDAQVEHGVLRV